MYYGYYSNYTLQSCRDNVSMPNGTSMGCASKQNSYNMPLAYFFTIGVSFFITCIILVYRYSVWLNTKYTNITGFKCNNTSQSMLMSNFFDSMSKSFGQSFRIDKSHSILAVKVFCSWDFKVIKRTSVKLMSENICTQLRVRVITLTHTWLDKNTHCLFVSPSLLRNCRTGTWWFNTFFSLYLSDFLSSGAPSRGES